MNEFKKYWLPRILIGAPAGMLVYLFISWLAQPGALFGGSLTLAFTFCFNSNVPEALGLALGLLLWAAFGAEVAVSTIPFADTGREMAVRSLLHYLVTSATVSAWAVLNFAQEPLPGYLLELLIPLTLVYLLVWLGRWIGWYMEVAAIRERLGLAPGPSLFKWRESLPYFGYAFLLCLALPLILRVLDAPDVPVLGLMYAWLLLPVGGFMSGLSLGKRQGVCPLYPVVCAGFLLIFLPLARLCSSMNDWPLVPTALLSALLGNLAGAAYTVRRRKASRYRQNT